MASNPIYVTQRVFIEALPMGAYQVDVIDTDGGRVPLNDFAARGYRLLGYAQALDGHTAGTFEIVSTASDVK